MNAHSQATVVQLPVAEFKTWMDTGRPFELFDVRTERERDIAKIEGARHLGSEAVHHLMTLDRATPLVFVCHHGIRSQAAARHFAREGFTRVFNLAGGIDAWSREVDDEIPLY